MVGCAILLGLLWYGWQSAPDQTVVDDETGRTPPTPENPQGWRPPTEPPPTESIAPTPPPAPDAQDGEESATTTIF